MPSPTSQEESLPLLTPSASSSGSTPQPLLSPVSRSKLGARRHLTDKARGKQRAVDTDVEAQHPLTDPRDDEAEPISTGEREKRVKVDKGRRVTIIFSNEGKEGNLELWVEPGETVGSVKDQVSHPLSI